jgi:hypothetical protein
MCVDKEIQLGKRIWITSEAIVVDSIGGSEGLCTIWNNYEVSLKFTMNTQHWILAKFKFI